MKLVEILVFVIFYFLAIGIVSSVFNPSMYNVNQDYKMPQGWTLTGYDSSNPNSVNVNWGDYINAFIGAGLTLDIPDVPLMVKILMLLPMYGALAYFVWCQLPIPFRKEG